MGESRRDVARVPEPAQPEPTQAGGHRTPWGPGIQGGSDGLPYPRRCQGDTQSWYEVHSNRTRGGRGNDRRRLRGATLPSAPGPDHQPGQRKGPGPNLVMELTQHRTFHELTYAMYVRR